MVAVLPSVHLPNSGNLQSISSVPFSGPEIIVATSHEALMIALAGGVKES